MPAGGLHHFIFGDARRRVVRVSRVPRALGGAMGAAALAVLWLACATPEPPRHVRSDVEATLPGPPPPDLVPESSHVVFREPTTSRPDPTPDAGAGPSSGATAGEGATGDCACTLEYRRNLCVTVDGDPRFPDGLAGVSFVRVRRVREGAADTLSAVDVAGGGRCFGEWRGVQRVLMLRDEAVIDSSEWFEIRTVDCCHGEARTVDFRMTGSK